MLHASPQNKERTGESFAHRVGDDWGVGDAGCDNGNVDAFGKVMFAPFLTMRFQFVLNI